MAEQEGGGKAIGVVVAGLGVAAVGLVKVLSHAPVDDIARIGGKSISEGSAIVDDVGRHLPSPGPLEEAGRLGDAADVADVTVTVGGAVYDGIVTRSEDEAIWLGELAEAGLLKRHRGDIVGFVARDADLSGWEAACIAAEAECWIYVGAAGAPEGAAIASWNASKEVPVPAEGFTVRVIGG